MKIEHNILTFGAGGARSGYIDLARALSAVNAKNITQTKRKDGKYKPLTYIVKVRTLVGSATIEYLPSSYPIRNSVVLAGAARDAMLESAGMKYSDLEPYQKELRLQMAAGITNQTMFFPFATSMGTSYGGFGETLNYDYTKLTIVRPDEQADSVTLPLVMLGEQNANEDSWDQDTAFYVIDNWRAFRHEIPNPNQSADPANNIFSWAMQQGSTAGDIIDLIDDEQDEKPYNLFEFRSTACSTFLSNSVGNPVSCTMSVPLGLLKYSTTGLGAIEVEVIGVTEL